MKKFPLSGSGLENVSFRGFCLDSDTSIRSHLSRGNLKKTQHHRDDSSRRSGPNLHPHPVAPLSVLKLNRLLSSCFFSRALARFLLCLLAPPPSLCYIFWRREEEEQEQQLPHLEHAFTFLDPSASTEIDSQIRRSQRSSDF